MSIQKSLVEVPLAGGIDTKTDEKLVQAPKLLDIRNGVFTEHGAIKKREGYSKLGHLDDSGNTLELIGMTTRGDELVGWSKTKLYSYAESSDTWYEKGPYRPLGLESTVVNDLNSSQTKPDFAQNESIAVYAWEDNRGGCYYSIYDVESNSPVVQPTQLDADAISPKVISTQNSGNIHILWIDNAANEMRCTTFSASDFDGVETAQGSADVDASNLMDADYHPDSGAIIYAYETTTSDPRIGWISSDGVFMVNGTAGPRGEFYTSSQIPASVENVDSWLTVASNGVTTVIMWQSVGGDPWMYVATSTYDWDAVDTRFEWAITLGTETQVSTNNLGFNSHTGFVAFRDNADKFDCWFNDSADIGTLGHDMRKRSFTGVVADGVEVVKTFGVVAQSQAIYFTPLSAVESSDYGFWGLYGFELIQAFGPFSRQTGFQNTFFLLDSEGLPLGRVFPALANDVATGAMAKPSLNSIVLNDKKRIDVDGDVEESYTNPGIQRVDIDPEPAVSTVTYNGSLYLSGGMLWQYDGGQPVEAGFLLIPELESFGSSNSTGGLDSTKAYFLNGCWEWYDAEGKRLLSASNTISVGPYDGVTPYSQTDVYNVRFLTAADNTILPSFGALVPTRKQGNREEPTLVVYRSEGNGLLKYAVTDPASPINNTVGVNPVFTDDSNTEPDLENDELGFLVNEFDYQSSGELGNIAAFAPYTLLSHDNRIFYVSSEDRNKVYFSKRPNEFSQPGFHEGLFIQAPQDGSVIEALGIMDNKLVIFKRNKIYIVSGSGPNNLGQGEYSTPRLVSTDTGCRDFRTVVRMPLGLMFQSDKGIMLFNRGESVGYIGAPVEAYNGESFVDATLLADKNEVRFLSATGRTLVYDYSFDAWTTFTQHQGLAAVNHNERYTYLRSDGTEVFTAASGTFTDAGQAYGYAVETPWFTQKGLQKFFRCYKVTIIGDFSSSHNLRIKVATNYKKYDDYDVTWNPDSILISETWGDSDDWGSDAVWGFSAEGSEDVYQVKHIPKYQKVQSIKFTLEEVPDSVEVGAAFELTGVALEVGSYRGAFRLPGAKAT